MKIRNQYLTGTVVAALLALAAPQPATAQVNGEGSMAVGGATVTVGGGTALLTLPDVEFTRNFNLSVPAQRNFQGQ
jgi:hypothetical protein